MSIEVPLERIRMQIVREKPSEMWGIIWVNRLPFCFRAWPLLHKNIRWGFVHAPYQPLSFTAPILTPGITEDDMAYMLEGLRVDNEEIEMVRQNGAISGLFTTVLGAKGEAYQNFYQLYDKDMTLRMAYCTAVSSACDKRETELHIPS